MLSEIINFASQNRTYIENEINEDEINESVPLDNDIHQMNTNEQDAFRYIIFVVASFVNV